MRGEMTPRTRWVIVVAIIVMIVGLVLVLTILPSIWREGRRGDTRIRPGATPAVKESPPVFRSVGSPLPTPSPRPRLPSCGPKYAIETFTESAPDTDRVAAYYEECFSKETERACLRVDRIRTNGAVVFVPDGKPDCLWREQ